jgi:hypothetical protein
MDQTALVNKKYEDGQALVNQLPLEGVPVTTAFWMKTSEEGQFYLYIVSPVAHGEEKLAAYAKVSAAMRKMPQPFWVGPFDVKLVPPESPIGRAVTQQTQFSSGFPTSGSGALSASGALVEGFYPYPPQSAPSS